MGLVHWDTMSEPRPAYKIWIETDDGHVFGPGVYTILKTIQVTGTLKEAAERLDMSYRYAWGLVKKAEEKLGESLVDASKGGKSGGGASTITELGLKFIEDFEHLQTRWRIFLSANDSSVSGVITGINELKHGSEVVIETESRGLLKGDKVFITVSRN